MSISASISNKTVKRHEQNSIYSFTYKIYKKKKKITKLFYCKPLIIVKLVVTVTNDVQVMLQLSAWKVKLTY